MSTNNIVQKDNLTDLVHSPKPSEPPKSDPKPQQPQGQVVGSSGNPITLGFGSQKPNNFRK